MGVSFFVNPGWMSEGRCTVRSATLPSTSFEVAGSTPMEPEQYTKPWHLMAWEKKGSGRGALSVLTASLRTMFAVGGFV